MNELTLERRSKRAQAERVERARSCLKATARLAVLGLALAAPSAALAYVGPGAGLGILGVIAAVLAAVVMGFFGLVMWPIRKLAQQRKAQAQEPSRERANQSARREAATEPRSPNRR